MNIIKWVLQYLVRAYKLHQLSNVGKMKNDVDTSLLLAGLINFFLQCLLSAFSVLSHPMLKRNACLVSGAHLEWKGEESCFSHNERSLCLPETYYCFWDGFFYGGVNYLKPNCLAIIINKAGSFPVLGKTSGPLFLSSLFWRGEQKTI